MFFRIDDEVEVIAGADKGHRGKILKIDRKKNKIVVEGAGRVWKHVRRSQKNPQGGRLNKEMPISAGIEGTQFLIPTRDPSLLDFGLNTAGGGLGLLLVTLVLPHPRRARPARA